MWYWPRSRDSERRLGRNLAFVFLAAVVFFALMEGVVAALVVMIGMVVLILVQVGLFWLVGWLLSRRN